MIPPFPLISAILKNDKKLNLTEQVVNEVCEEYKKFLFLAKTNPTANLVPSLMIDEVWHDHILHTKQYANDCNQIFGSYMHHLPSINEEGEDISETFQLYRNVFGTEPPCAYWNCSNSYCTKCCGNVCSKQCKNCRKD